MTFRSDLLQFKQGFAVLDPAGVPILSETFAGNRADDPCYLPAWRRMVHTLGSPDFLEEPMGRCFNVALPSLKNH